MPYLWIIPSFPYTCPNTGSEPKDSHETMASTGFAWPEYRISASDIELKNNAFAYSVGTPKPQQGQFNANAMAYSDVNLSVTDVSYEPKNLTLNVEQLSFVEKSGFQLNHLQFKVLMDDSKASLTDVQVRTKNSSLKGSTSVTYRGLDAIYNNPKNVNLDITIPNFEIALQDAFVFSPDLETNEYVNTLATVFLF